MVSTAFDPDGTPIVLVVDDCEFVHELLQTRLRSEAVRLIRADHGQQAMDIAVETPPALILLDLNMPVMDGFETLRHLKDNPVTRDIPVIVLSGQDSAEDKVTAFDLGAVDFVAKPFDLTELRARLRSALRIHSLMQILAQRAQIDGLTGLWNRACFDERWSQEHARSLRSEHPLTLAMLDIDRFKSVNDTYGHPAGDAVIAGVSRLLQQMLRASDIPCRYGGEEFAIILPETTPDEAGSLCERIRAACEELTWARHPSKPITVSIGVAGMDSAGVVSSSSWVEAADKAMYLAKNEGRNQIRVTKLDRSGGQSPGLRVA